MGFILDLGPIPSTWNKLGKKNFFNFLIFFLFQKCMGFILDLGPIPSSCNKFGKKIFFYFLIFFFFLKFFWG